MPRRKAVNFIRDIGVDQRFRSPVIQRLINMVMENGKKAVATSIVYDAMDVLKAKFDGDDAKALDFFVRAIGQIRPVVEVKSRRVGGGVYQVPVEVRSRRADSLTMRWLIGAAKKRSEKTMGKRLAAELLDAVQGNGAAMKKKIDVHRMAEANRAFSHYAW